MSLEAEMTPQGLFTLRDLSAERLHALARRSVELLSSPNGHGGPLAGKVVGVLFTKTSTRTRTAFTVGSLRLGASVVTYGPDDLQTNTGESLADTGRVFGAMLDGLVVRTAGPVEDMRTLAATGDLPVINAMSQEEHPTQGLCDVATMLRVFDRVNKLRILYLGEGNNSAVALANAVALMPDSECLLATPPGYGIPEPTLRDAAERAAQLGTTIRQVHDVPGESFDADVVYTTRWQTTGTSKPDASWRESFRPFYIDPTLLDRWPRARFMHDLPAHRGEEVAGAVLDGERSVAWVQASMKLASAMAVLEWQLDG
jgi:ornithine carbamoyltransferase